MPTLGMSKDVCYAGLGGRLYKFDGVWPSLTQSLTHPLPEASETYIVLGRTLGRTFACEQALQGFIFNSLEDL